MNALGPWRVAFCPECGQAGTHADTCGMFPGEPVVQTVLCEVCEKPIPDGQEVVHPEEGDSYCARCVVGLIGAERDALDRQLAAAVAAFAQERQAVLDCVNLYGDETLHKALDSIGWPAAYTGGGRG